MNGTDDTQCTNSEEFSCVVIASQNALISVPFLVSVLMILMNAVQLWFLKTKFKREVNTLFVMIEHLCLADLLTGGTTIIAVIFNFLQWKVLANNSVVTLIIQFLIRTASFYLFTVSTITLSALTLLKMQKVTRNKLHQRAAVKRLCYCIWVPILLPSAIDYI